MARKKEAPAPEQFHVCLRCYYPPSEYGKLFTTHHRDMPLADIPKWIEAYRFTHPDCLSITAKVWMNGEENDEAEQDDDIEQDE